LWRTLSRCALKHSRRPQHPGDRRHQVQVRGRQKGGPLRHGHHHSQWQRKGIRRRIMASEEVGTLFLPKEDRLTSKKHWIAFSTRPSGRLFVDDGARRPSSREKKPLALGRKGCGRLVRLRRGSTASTLRDGVRECGQLLLVGN
jgi:hypothetical protein